MSQVEPRTFLPLWSIALTTMISLCLALINIGSTTAFNAFIGLTIAAFYTTFLAAASVLLIQRLTKSPSKIRPGPFTLGRLALPINILSIAYSIIGIFFSFWPPAPDVTAQSMNWSIAVYGGVMIFSVFLWLVHGKNVYTGPIVEVHGDHIHLSSE